MRRALHRDKGPCRGDEGAARFVVLRPDRIVPTILLSLLCASLLLQPLQCLRLPANLQAPDLAALAWIALAAPWLLAAGRSRPVPLLGPFLLLLAASSVSAACSRDPVDSMTALAVETWLYGWFVALTFAFAASDERARRRILGSWVAAGVGNGLWILAQFARPDLQAAASAALGSFGSLDPFRPSGMFENCNSAAFFQLSALAPLATLRPRLRVTLPCGLALVLSILATGSMGALIGLAAAAAAALAGALFVQRDAATFARWTVVGAAVAAFVATVAAAATLADPEFAHRVDYVLTGRGEGSAQSRMGLWTRGVELLRKEFLPFGIGPDRFKAVAGFGMHNDALATAVERGVPGIAAAAVLAVATWRTAARVARRGAAARDQTALVPLAALAACVALSTTHEILHQRPLWLLLALVCAMDQRRCPFTSCSTAATTCSTSASSIRE